MEAELQEDGQKVERRQRKKKLINEVKDLLEFYFSPANLGKDKFMWKLLDNDPYIDLNIFHRFNKIKSLTNETKILQKAVKKSDILEISEDGTKVKRGVALEMKEDEMECTIYVENLPPNSTHEWLQKVFSLYGTIDYISLPRFHQTGRPKGFAFIEFHTPQEAQKALEAFGGLASLDGTLNPGELLTIRTYGQVKESPEENQDATSTCEIVSEKDTSTKKRSQEEAFSNDAPELDQISTKKLKENEEDTDTETKKKKKKRRRSKKEKEFEPDSVYLRVMSKRDWKSLRNKYLNIQRENMNQLKYSMQYQNTYPTEQSWEFETNESSTTQNVGKSKRPKFIANVIVKIALNEPPENPREFREGLANGRSCIAYIDMSDGKDIYVRFKSPDDSKPFIKEGLWENVSLLEGQGEHEYWEKVFTSWDQRGSRKKKKNAAVAEPPNFRGRDKLVNKAFNQKNKESSSRIVFED